MYFKKLELSGFKSFCDKTTLNFEPGVTAIVGPNGCGKSNLLESIRWVLGEQSAKSLRGSTMQDVIFNGTDLKEPLGLAEVTLTFDNSSGFFNLSHPEISITRRIFRSGESEYLLNKVAVRLKDIQDLLLGTGIGAESYSIVAQGRIDLVLSSRPEERRQVLDEASGITKYKAQKREALRKLEETQQNLLRVNDIVAEVKRQIASLERQANKARRYKDVFEELKSKEVILSLSQKKLFLEEKEKLAKELTGTSRKEAEFVAALKEREEKIANRQSEISSLEERIMSVKNQILNAENLIVRNNEHADFNRQRIEELAGGKEYLEAQVQQLRNRIVLDEEKLNNVKAEYERVSNTIDEKTTLLVEKEREVNGFDTDVKNSYESIRRIKKEIMNLAVKLSAAKNELADFKSREQLSQARSKRLEIEKIKSLEEKALIEKSLEQASLQAQELAKAVEGLNQKIGGVEGDLKAGQSRLESIDSESSILEKEKLSLTSHKEFLEKFKTKYEGLGESINAQIHLDKPPQNELDGLVVKIVRSDIKNLNFFGEAKPIELDTAKISEKIKGLEGKLSGLKEDKNAEQKRIDELKRVCFSLARELRAQEIALANKETSCQTILEHFNKVKDEADLIIVELQETGEELANLAQSIALAEKRLKELLHIQEHSESLIQQEQQNIELKSKEREEALMIVTQIKTELEGFSKRMVSDEATLKILEETYAQDRQSLDNIQAQIRDSAAKGEMLNKEIRECLQRNEESARLIQEMKGALEEIQARYAQASEDAAEAISRIEADHNALNHLRSGLHKLELDSRDIDYKYSAIKERMLQVYRIDLETAEFTAQESPDINLISEEIAGLRKKVDSYGNVNLVAIEEYDELKKRYDFLIQQQTDLASARESLQKAIQRINRTTKQMFLETFEKVRVEFREYFRLLFNGGDAQLFLIDESNPLDSGIEIICRPPGKKLQNVLLLSGGEKSMSAIALIFAIFKVKPSPFCVLDEIDAALDEANVDRFGRLLQEFAGNSQFLVITHNKKTIVSANVMYGITMQESGVSKIVSVKLDKGDEPKQQAEADITPESLSEETPAVIAERARSDEAILF